MSNDEKAVPEAALEDEPEQAVGEAPEDSDNADAQAPEELHALLTDARSKADEHWNQCLRLQADLENLRKRAERDVASAHKFALERFAAELLPVRDSLEMGLATAVGGQVDPAGGERFIISGEIDPGKGVEMAALAGNEPIQAAVGECRGSLKHHVLKEM